LLAGIELVADRPTKQPFPAHLRLGHAVCKRARAHGAILRPLGDVIVLMPPLAIEPDLLDRLGVIVHDSIRDVCQEVSHDRAS
jgi:adenosylmethionine-8-amino-7-oxononanoate aminotransferase